MATPFTVYKLIVLYMLQNTENTLTNSQISEFILDREYTNYFHLQQAISELVEAELITMDTRSNVSHYRITEDGIKTLSFFQKDLSPEIKQEVREYLKSTGFKAQERIVTPADYYITKQGTYSVRCQLIEKGNSLIDLNIATSLAGPGMLSLVKQASAKATALENFSTDTIAGIPVEESPRIALTFDDGPNARYTPILLDGLKKRNIRASFFLIGENIEGNEDILLQMRKDGHLIGNHTWDHVQLDKIPAEKARLEIEKTNNRIYEASGIYPSYVRPPFGAWIKDMELSVTMLPVFWDVDTLDWKSKNIDSILSIAQTQVHDGSIILMHDGYQTSVDAALKIADLFTEKGYVFVTADQLLLT